MINNIKNNTISEADAKKKRNALNEIKRAERRNKRLVNGQKKLLDLFVDLPEAIFNNSNNEINNNNMSESENENGNQNKNENKNENDNENENKNENESESEKESESNNNDFEKYRDHKIKQLHNYFKEIGETKSFEEQIHLFKKRDYIDEY